MKKVLAFALFAVVACAGLAAAAMTPVNLPASPAAFALPTPVADGLVLEPELLSNPKKTTVCHKHQYDGNQEKYITINIKNSNLSNHLSHGDCYYSSDWEAGCECNLSSNDFCEDQSPNSCSTI